MPGVTSSQGFVTDETTGLLVPSRHAGRYQYTKHPLDGLTGFVQSGLPLERDQETGVWMVPGYATGYDDLLMRIIVRGEVRNVDVSPVIDSYLSTLVAKRQAMASTWQIILTGRRSPVQRFLDVLAAANDGAGIADFIKDYIGALDVDNRGAFYATVPITAVDVDKWGEYGMRLVPIVDPDKPYDDRFYLEVDQDAYRENYGLWSVDGLDCSPTGNGDWPFWYSTYSAERKKQIWILIPSDYGGQELQKIGPRDRTRLGYGQSGTWRYLSILAKDILIREMDTEALMNQPPRGIVWGSGLDTPTQLRDQLVRFKQEKEKEGALLYPGVIFGGSVNDKSGVAIVRWTEPPAGYTPNEWKKHREDVLAACFHMSVSQIVTRLGEGAFTQTRVTDDIQAETGIAWMRNQIERVSNKIAPPRVTVMVNWLSDRQRRYQVETLQVLADAVQRLQRAADEPVLTIQEIRAMIEEYGAVPIPHTDEREDTRSERDAGEDIGGDDRTPVEQLAPQAVTFIIGGSMPSLPDTVEPDEDGISRQAQDILDNA